eukprot:5977642-Alexandrium_andersonii.AAC.2
MPTMLLAVFLPGLSRRTACCLPRSGRERLGGGGHDWSIADQPSHQLARPTPQVAVPGLVRGDARGP